MSFLHDLHRIYDQSFPPKPTYSVDDVPDLSGKVVIITGGGSGMGYETTKVLLRRNAKVYIATRNAVKTKEAIEQLEAETGRKALFLQLELTSLASVKRAAEEFKGLENQLHILYNHAGIGGAEPLLHPTSESYETAMATNVLGHFYLTKLLLPLLQAAASSRVPARVINTSSVTHYICREMDFDTFKEGPARRRAWHWSLYAQSKLANIVLSSEIHKRYNKDGVISIAVNPGNLITPITRYASPFEKLVTDLAFYPQHLGCLTLLWAATAEETAKLGGRYLIPWGRLGEPAALCQNEELGRNLWEWLEEQVQSEDARSVQAHESLQA